MNLKDKITEYPNFPKKEYYLEILVQS